MTNKTVNDKEYVRLGVHGNAGFALLGEDFQSGEVEFVEIDLPPIASEDPNRYTYSGWCHAANIAAYKAFWKLRERFPDRQFSYYYVPSHPDYRKFE